MPAAEDRRIYHTNTLTFFSCVLVVNDKMQSNTPGNLYSRANLTTMKKIQHTQILLLGENIPDAAEKVLAAYNIHRAVHPYQVKALLAEQNKKDSTIRIYKVIIPIREWNLHLFEGFKQLTAMPSLILMRDHLDKMDDLEGVHHWKEPYKETQLLEFIEQPVVSDASTFDCLYFMVNRRFVRIPCDDIVLIRKYPQNQLVICTRDTDYAITLSINVMLQKLPADQFERISDNLAVPNKYKKNLTFRGYPFRGGYIPVTHRFRSIRKSLYHEDLV